MPWGTGSSWKNRLFFKTVNNSKKAKHSFVDACITRYPKPVRFNNSQQKVLSFLFKDFLLFSGRVESRDNLCIIEKHHGQTPHMYVVFKCSEIDHPNHFFTESFGANALIYLRN